MLARLHRAAKREVSKMKLLIYLSLAAAALAAPGSGLAQKTSTLPVDQAEGFEQSNKLNKSIIDGNRAAADREAANQAAFRAQVAANEQAVREAKVRYDAQIKADADKVAR